MTPPLETSASTTGSLPDDAQLLPLLRAADPAAFRQWVTASTPRLLAVARRYLPDESDARDAVQDAFVSAVQALPRFEGASKLSTWLHRILVNACLMKLRSRRSRPEQSIDALLPTFLPDGHATTPTTPWRLPAARDDDPHTQQLVRACLAQLPDNYRVALLLRDVEGLSTDEAAHALGVTPNALKIRVHRARQALRTLLEPHFSPAGEAKE